MRELPMVMPSNRVKMAREISQDHPGRLGCLFSPEGWEYPHGLPYALDNGCFSTWARGRPWKVSAYKKFIDKVRKYKYPPMWCLVPDSVGNKHKTFEMWHKWTERLLPLNWPLALAVQDGMLVEEVLALRPSPAVIFVGGTTTWKWRTVSKWTASFPKVHVGRVNTGRLLWVCQKHNAMSSDGTGWWHDKQRKQLVEYLRSSGRGETPIRRGFLGN